MKKLDEVKWGMIGCGDVTERKSAPAFNKIEGSSLVAVMSRTEERVRNYAQRHGVSKWCTDAVELINDPEVNAIYIATPPNSHCDYTLMAAEAGKPVYVEKPMACTLAECERMIAACEQAEVPLFVAYYRRCLPNFLKVKELVDSGAIGEVRFVSIMLLSSIRAEDKSAGEQDTSWWRVIPEIAGGGYFMDLASHQMDYLDYLLGPVKSVGGHALNQAGLYPAEDIVVGHFVFESGVAGNGMWCFTVPENSRADQIILMGSEGKITFSSFRPDPVILETGGGDRKEFNLPMPEHVQQPLIQTIVDQLRGEGECPSTGTSAARTNRVLEAMLVRPS